MTKADLVARVCEQVGPGVSKRDCAMIVDHFLGAVKESLAEGNHIEIRGFGTFKVRDRSPRPARNPRTGDSVNVPGKPVAVFKVSKDLKKAVEDGSAGK